MVGVPARHRCRGKTLSLAFLVDDVLLPGTDAGTVGQVLGVLAVTIAVVWLVRRERALVTLVIGGSIVLLGFFGLRGLH